MGIQEIVLIALGVMFLVFILWLFAILVKLMRTKQRLLKNIESVQREINAESEERVTRLKEMLSVLFEDGLRVDEQVEKITESERKFMKFLVDVFGSGESERILNLNIATEKMIEPYHMLLKKQLKTKVEALTLEKDMAVKAREETQSACQTLFDSYIKMTAASELSGASIPVKEMLDKVSKNPLTCMLPDDIKEKYDGMMNDYQAREDVLLNLLNRLFLEYIKLFNYEVDMQKKYSLDDMEHFIENGRFSKADEEEVVMEEEG